MSNRRDWQKPAGLLIIILLMLLLDLVFFPFLVDDSFISYRYALNLLEGKGLVFNPGERVEGYSNFLWVILLAGLRSAGMPIILASKLLGVILALGSVVMVFALSRRLSDDKGFFPLTAVVLLATDIGFVRWSVAGMETQLAGFLFLLALFFFLKETERGSGFPVSGFILGLCSLTRPEGPVLFVAALAFRIFRRRGDWSASDTVWVVSYVAVMAPFLVFRYSYYGALLPNSYFAKTGGGLKRVIVGIKYANQFFAANGGYLLLPLMFLPFICRRSKLSPLYPFLLAYLFFIVYVGGDHMDDHRFFIPILPVIFILAQEGLVTFKPFLKRWGRVILSLTVLGLLLSNLVHDYYTTGVRWWGDLRGQSQLLKEGIRSPGENYDRARVGLWLRENVESSTVIAVEDCGMIPYYSGLVTIDMFGLMDTHLARLEGMMHRKFDAAYVLEREPDIVILIRYPEWLGDEPFWQSEIDRSLVASDAFQEGYRMLHRIEGSERWFLIYERRS